MPTISGTISNADAVRLIDAYCGLYDYHATIPTPDGVSTMPNPETRQQFAERMLKRRAFKEPVKRWETRVATAAAEGAAEIDVT